MKRLLFSCILLPIIFSSCKKEDQGNVQQYQKGVVTTVGTPDVNPVSKSIGTAGGSITSADGKLSIDFPAGALPANETVTIQPITNQGPAGINKAYRISPHNIQFAKPVKLTFHYSDSDTAGSAAQYLGIAYQDPEGVWQAVRYTEVNTSAKTVSVTTTHFSDWNMFQGLAMKPEIVPALVTGQSVDLKVYVAMEDVFVKLPSDADLVVPLPNPKEVPEKYVKQWIKSGEGTLAANGNQAKYTAPSTVPARNPVSVTAVLNIAGKGEYMLVCNITIISAEGILVSAGGGAGSGSHKLIRVPQASYDTLQNRTRISAYEEGGDAQNSKRIEISFPGRGENIGGAFDWNRDNGVQVSYIVKTNGVNTVYNSWFSDASTWYNSPGSLGISSYGKKAGEYVTGQFTASKAGYADGGKTFTTLNGSFSVQLTR